MTDYVLGIDPGATGALALFNCSQGIIAGLWDTPNTTRILSTKKKQTQVDFDKLFWLFDNIVNSINLESDRLVVHIEKVQAFGKQSAPAAFNFGYAACAPRMLAVAFGLEILMIPPQTWKRQLGLQASAKDEARLLAIDLFPHLATSLSRKLDVDRADAILISLYKP